MFEFVLNKQRYTTARLSKVRLKAAIMTRNAERDGLEQNKAQKSDCGMRGMVKMKLAWEQ